MAEFLVFMPGDEGTVSQPSHGLATVRADRRAVVNIIGFDSGDPPGDPGFNQPVEGGAGGFIDPSLEGLGELADPFKDFASSGGRRHVK